MTKTQNEIDFDNDKHFYCHNCSEYIKEEDKIIGIDFTVEIRNIGAVVNKKQKSAEWGTHCLIQCNNCGDQVSISHKNLEKHENLKDLL